METPSYHYIGNIRIKSIRDFILDNHLTENDIILLNPINFDDIVLEFRDTYNESIDVPHFLIGVLIEEDHEKKVPGHRLTILKNANNGIIKSLSSRQEQPDESYSYETIYRCGWCGNIVDSDGSEFDPESREFKIKIHQKFRNTISEKSVNGKCCKDRYRR
jgi:hypothetical protein